MKKVLSLTVLSCCWLLAVCQSYPENHPASQWAEQPEKIEFWVSSGWQFIEGDHKASNNSIDIEALQPLSGAASLNAATFDASSFDPLKYDISLTGNKALIFVVGERGILYFYSKSRFEVLYNRARANQAAAEKRGR